MKSLNRLIFIYAIILGLRIFGGPIYGLPQIVSVGFTILFVALAITRARVRTKISQVFILFFSYLILALFITSPNPVFKSWERLIYFILMLLLLSPVLENDLLRFIRYKTLKYLSLIIIFAALGSFIAYFVGINWMRASNELDISTAGHFGGLTNQSMILGPIAGITSCIFLYRFDRTQKFKYLFYTIIAFITVLFSASRGATLATIGGLSILTYLSSNIREILHRRKMVFLIICVLLSPIFFGASSGVLQKSQDSNRSGVFDSRTTKFLARLMEIEKSPIYGIGFSAIDPNGVDNYDHKTGTIEPGSSVLAVISMTGIIGFIFMMYINIRAIIIVKRSTLPQKNLILALITLFLLHMIVEGYIFAITNPLSIYFWLLIGVANDSRFFHYTSINTQKTIRS